MGLRRMSNNFVELPRLYPILDADALARTGVPLVLAARTLYDAGVRWVQYRDKRASDAEVVERMRALRTIFPAGEAALLVNDRVHLCDEVGADGVHIGQEDMAPAKARRMLGAGKLLGVSTHKVTQLRAAVKTRAADYLAIGPVYGTGSKENPDPVLGLEGVRAARAITVLPLVAIGGITAETAREVLEAGADAVAVISALLPPAGHEAELDMSQTVRDFLHHLR
ncbi:MAG TPA: thiamine phosphate synthase [Acidobacteriaceae bacterium]